MPLWALWFGLAGAPAMWAVQVFIGYAVIAHACFPQSVPLAMPSTAAATTIALVATVIAAIGAAAAGITAIICWRRTVTEKVGGGHAALEVGEGRTRFMALAGAMVSALFLLAIVMSFLSIAVLAPCSYGA